MDPSGSTTNTTAPDPKETTNEPSFTEIEARIQLLTDLNKQVEKLRQIPASLLRTSTSNISNPISGHYDDQNKESNPDPLHIREEFQDIKNVAEKLRSENAQAALAAAKESEKKDSTELDVMSQRHPQSTAIQGGPSSPESPQPTFSQPGITKPLFPTLNPGIIPLRLKDLSQYIIEHNKTHKSRLHIWLPSSARKHSSLKSNTNTNTKGVEKLKLPIVIRFMIRDVFTVYSTLGYSAKDKESRLFVESAAAFAPRERRPPHSQSEYTVYREMSQQLAKSINLQPNAPVQLIIGLLEAYEDLFSRQCSVCKRVLSEGHVPPVARIWLRTNEWDARHAYCNKI
ncbi:Mediator complex subunit 27 family protein [Abortiporus biennis]